MSGIMMYTNIMMLVLKCNGYHILVLRTEEYKQKHVGAQPLGHSTRNKFNIFKDNDKLGV